MEFKILTEENAKEFTSLIKDMYENLENLEWFSPMPYDEENVREILLNPRFFVLGAFENGKLCAVSSFDFKCGKLIGKNFMPQDCSLENTVEIGFTMVRDDCKGRGIMKSLICELENYAKKFDKKYFFGKVHVDNLASSKSFLSQDYAVFSRFEKQVNRDEFQSFLKSGLLKKSTQEKAEISLQKNVGDIIVDYEILIKKLDK